MALSVTEFIVERLLEYDPTFDTGGGIATTALMINPLSVVMQPLRDELDGIEEAQSILSVLESDDPDAFDEDVVDALASNVFIERNEGNKSSGTVRVRYFSPQDTEFGQGLASFLDSSGNRYVNTEAASITAAEMATHVEGSLYYLDIPVESEEQGLAQNIDAGGIQTFESEPPNVANVTNLAAFASGADRETNTELIDRIRVAVTVRALVTGRGIITTMTENFTSIEEINPRGFGDPEMQRDIVYNTHIGGHVDVWTKTPSFTNENYDVVSVVPDVTRQVPGASTATLITASTDYPLTHFGIDRTNFTPIVKSVDGFVTFAEGTDYILNDATGQIQRVASGNIFHITGTGASVSGGKTLTDAGAFTLVRPGMVLTITASTPNIDGTYMVKSALAGSLEIYGSFPETTATGVSYFIDDTVSASYEYNPLSVDVIATSRSSSRDDYTITDTPVMKIKSVERLDLATLQPTGQFLDATGGYGQGGFGTGAFGVGTGADYVMKVIIPNLRFSALEDNVIEFTGTWLGASFRINYDHAPEIGTYQTFADDPSNNVETAKLVAKHFIPIFVNSDGAITYYVSASNSSALSEADMQTAVEDHIDTIPIGTDLEVSDIIDMLYNGGAHKVDLGISLVGEVHNTDGELEYLATDTSGVMEIPDRTVVGTELPQTDQPLTKQITHFIPGTILLNRVTT